MYVFGLFEFAYIFALDQKQYNFYAEVLQNLINKLKKRPSQVPSAHGDVFMMFCSVQITVHNAL